MESRHPLGTTATDGHALPCPRSTVGMAPWRVGHEPIRPWQGPVLPGNLFPINDSDIVGLAICTLSADGSNVTWLRDSVLSRNGRREQMALRTQATFQK